MAIFRTFSPWMTALYVTAVMAAVFATLYFVFATPLGY